MPITSDGAAVGFLGLGLMGRPMATNLVRAGLDVLVWNRSPGPAAALADAGARVASSPAEVFDSCPTVLLMLADDDATDAVLAGTARPLRDLVDGRLVVNLATVPPPYSANLARRVGAAGGRYVECPVSGSRGPAEQGTLVGLLAGAADDKQRVRPLLEPLCRDVTDCGEVPAGQSTKLAVNLFLVTLVAGLAESFAMARAQGLDAGVLEQVLRTGPMASAVSVAKGEKLLRGDFEPQASVANVLYNCELIWQEARAHGARTPLLDATRGLFAETAETCPGLDMAAVVHALLPPAEGPA